jgi:membrane protein
VSAGAFATTLLFMLGKFAISFYVSKSNIGSTFGTAGSLVILLVWYTILRSSYIFGAEFTKAWSLQYGSPIQPNHYAITTKVVEVEAGKATIQEKKRKSKI